MDQSCKKTRFSPCMHKPNHLIRHLPGGRTAAAGSLGDRTGCHQAALQTHQRIPVKFLNLSDTTMTAVTWDNFKITGGHFSQSFDEYVSVFMRVFKHSSNSSIKPRLAESWSMIHGWMKWETINIVECSRESIPQNKWKSTCKPKQFGQKPNNKSFFV